MDYANIIMKSLNYSKNYVAYCAVHADGLGQENHTKLSYILIADNNVHSRIFNLRTEEHEVKHIAIVNNYVRSSANGLISVDRNSTAFCYDVLVSQNIVPHGYPLVAELDTSHCYFYESSMQKGNTTGMSFELPPFDMIGIFHKYNKGNTCRVATIFYHFPIHAMILMEIFLLNFKIIKPSKSEWYFKTLFTSLIRYYDDWAEFYGDPNIEHITTTNRYSPDQPGNYYLLKSQFVSLHSNENGGAISSNALDANFLIESSSATSCSSDLRGGAIYIQYSGVVVSKCIFRACKTLPDGHGQSFYSLTSNNVKCQIYDMSDSETNNERGHYCICMAYANVIAKNINYTKNYVGECAVHTDGENQSNHTKLSYFLIADNNVHSRIFNIRFETHDVKHIAIVNNHVRSSANGLISSDRNAKGYCYEFLVSKNLMPNGYPLVAELDDSHYYFYESSMQKGNSTGINIENQPLNMYMIFYKYNKGNTCKVKYINYNIPLNIIIIFEISS